MVIALLVPLVLVLDGMRVLANDRYVRLEYSHAGLAGDGPDLPKELRLRLALDGLHAIQGSSAASSALLDRARLADGRPAFTGRELRHMKDVRGLFHGAVILQLVLLGVLVALAGGLALSRRTRAAALRGLRAGALLTVGLVALAALWLLVRFDLLLLGFHKLLFTGESWHFADSDTLIRVYPERFWSDTGRAVAALTLAQALVLYALARLAGGRRREHEPG